MPVFSKLSNLVSPEEIRSMLGVSAKELNDGRVDLPVYLRGIKQAVRSLDPRILSTYEALPENGLTEEQDVFQDAFLQFVSWKTASLLAVSLPQFGVRSLTDGKAGFTRHADSAAITQASIDAEATRLGGILIEVAASLFPSAVAEESPFVGIFSFGASDPVTGA